MTDSLFNDDEDKNEIDPEKDYFEELVGEGKRYKTPAELARGKLEADRFIANLKREKEEALAELRGRQTIEDYLNRITKEKTTMPEREETDTQPTDRLTKEDIFNELEQRLKERDIRAEREANLRETRKKLAELGIPTTEVRLKATELGMTDEQVTALAQNSPKVFLELFGKRTNRNPNLPDGVNTTGLSVSTPARGQKYYDDLKKKSFKEYWSVPVQLQMEKDIATLGYEKFRNS